MRIAERSTNAADAVRTICMTRASLERFSRAGPRGRGREWATLGVHPLSWLLSNNRLEKVPVVSVPHTSSNRLLLSNQDKGCTSSVAHSLPLPLGPALLNLWSISVWAHEYWENSHNSYLYSDDQSIDFALFLLDWTIMNGINGYIKSSRFQRTQDDDLVELFFW